MLITCGASVTAVMRSRCIVELMILGVSACRKTSVDPLMKPASSGTDWPYMCDMGTMARARSGRVPRPVWVMARAVCTIWPWVRTTPLGSEVVPLVKMTSAMSPLPLVTDRDIRPVGIRDPSNRVEACLVDAQDRHAECGAASGSTSCPASRSVGSVRVPMRMATSVCMRRSSGTMTAPARQTAK